MCLKPLDGWQHPDGGKPLFQKPEKHFSYNKIKVPCNYCSDCLKNRKTEWSLRMIHEASLWEQNHFITFTYETENLPDHHHLQYKDFKAFMKRLRFHLSKQNIKIRFIVSGEYGEQKGRPHFHAIIYNLPIHDLELVSNKNNNKLYESEFIQSLWQHGTIKIGEVNSLTCGYVAKYMTKKDLSTWNGVDLETGEIIAEYDDKGEITRIKPMHRRSNRPGIGHDWAKKWYKDFIPSGFITYEGKKFPVPNYYLDVALREHPELETIIEQMKIDRMLALETDQFKANNTPERLETRIKYNEAIEKRYQSNKSSREAFQ